MKRNTFNLLIISTLILGRIIPHPYNMTPTITFALLSTQLFSRRHAIAVSLLCFILSDAILALLQHHSVWGTWSLFTYSAITLIAYTSSITQNDKNLKLFKLLIYSSLGFWLWTNLGCWITMPTYSKDIHGLLLCFTLALPFLKNQLIGDSLWLMATLGALHHFKKHTSLNRQLKGKVR